MNLTKTDSPPPSMADAPDIPDSVKTITVSSAFNIEFLRIQTMIRTKSLQDAIVDLFGKNILGIYWADQIQSDSILISGFGSMPFTAKQLCKIRENKNNDGISSIWLDSEMLDIINGLFLIAADAREFDAKTRGMHHIVDTFEHRKTIIVFSCNFSTKIIGSDNST